MMNETKKATRRQTWAIFCMTGKDVREFGMTIDDAAQCIDELKKFGQSEFDGILLEKKKSKSEVTDRDKDIMLQLRQMYRANMSIECATNHNEVAITVSGGGEKKTFIEKDFFSCGATWYSLPSNMWRFAQKLGFKKGWHEWTADREYSNGKYELSITARSKALSTVQEEHPDVEWLKHVGVGTWID